MNWGKSIILAFVLFAGLIITMVVMSMQYDVNLVAPDYYEEELAYQDQIDRITNFENLAVKPVFDKTSNQIILTFPAEIAVNIKDGEILFFRPSDHKVDRKFELKLDDNHKQVFASSILSKGLWKAKLKWSNGSKEYFTEQTIVL